jgi:hypothetical protein
MFEYVLAGQAINASCPGSRSFLLSSSYSLIENERRGQEKHTSEETKISAQAFVRRFLLHLTSDWVISLSGR